MALKKFYAAVFFMFCWGHVKWKWTHIWFIKCIDWIFHISSSIFYYSGILHTYSTRLFSSLAETKAIYQYGQVCWISTFIYIFSNMLPVFKLPYTLGLVLRSTMCYRFIPADIVNLGSVPCYLSLVGPRYQVNMLALLLVYQLPCWSVITYSLLLFHVMLL